jgi:TRAP-type C4-dicarboxylate transport system substrate-binding protein
MKMSRLVASMVAASALLLATSSGATTTLRMATLAPKESPWGKVFRAWSEAVRQKTHGTVETTWFWNGVGGPERSVVGKIRTGELAGGALTAAGLASVYKPIVALQMPGAFDTWAELDEARAALRPEFDAQLAKAGFEVVGWGDVGRARTFSKGFEIRLPADLRGHTPVVGIDDSIAPKVLSVIGRVTGRSADVNEILPMLENGSIDVVTAPALAVEQLQWAAYLDHMNTGVAAFGIGATILSQRALTQLTADEREIVRDTGRRASQILEKQIRNEDDASFARLKQKMSVHEPTGAERAAWHDVWKKACIQVKEALPGDVLAKIGYC